MRTARRFTRQAANRAWTRRALRSHRRCPSSECAGESGSDSTSSPARSATGSGGCSGKRSRYQRQRVHREEVDARRDALLRECALVLVSRRARTLGVDPDDVEVVRVPVSLVPRERLDPVEPGDGGVVEGELPAADLVMSVDLVELDERDRRRGRRGGSPCSRAPGRRSASRPRGASRGGPAARRRGRLGSWRSARPRRRRRSSSRRARSRSRRRGPRACGPGMRSRPRVLRPRRRAGPAPRAARGRQAGRRGGRA